MDQSTSFGGRLARITRSETARTGAIRVTSVVLGTLATAYIARVLQPENFGLYAFVMSVVTIAAIPTTIGLRQTVTRETAYAMAREDTRHVYRIWSWAAKIATGISIAIAVAMAAWAIWMARDPAFSIALLCGAAVLVLLPAPQILGGALQGLGRVALSQAPQFVIRPLGLLVLLVLVGALAGMDRLSVPSVFICYAGGVGLAAVVGGWFLWRHAPPRPDPGAASHLDGRVLVLSAVSFGAIASIQLLNNNLAVLMLGALSDNAEAGLYRAASTISALVSFGLVVVNAVIMPQVARCHAKDDYATLQALVTRGARLITVLALIGLVVLVAGGQLALGLLFGDSYVAAYPVLVILAAGQLANALFGPVALILNMTGHEKLTLMGVSMAAVLHVILNLILVPAHGMTGAAVATAVTMLGWNLILAILLWRRASINSTCISLKGQA